MLILMMGMGMRIVVSPGDNVFLNPRLPATGMIHFIGTCHIIFQRKKERLFRWRGTFSEPRILSDIETD